MNSSRHLIVLFGAAVRPDGSPSPALARRIAFAEAAARRYVDAAIFCSGAKGEHGPSEARVMAAILGRTIDPARLHLDEESADTLQQVRAAAAYAKAHHYRQCLTCTDGYHQPRVRMLFALLGIRTRAVHLPHAGKRRYRARMGFREALALPYDLVAGTAAIVRKRQASRRAA